MPSIGVTEGYGGLAGPGAKSSPWNQAEQEQHKALKRRLKAQEREERDAENARTVSMGQKPCQTPSLQTTLRGL